MEKKIETLRAFLYAVGCNIISGVCHERFEALKAAVLEVDEPTFSARYQELEFAGQMALERLEEDYERDQKEMAARAKQLELARKCGNCKN